MRTKPVTKPIMTIKAKYYAKALLISASFFLSLVYSFMMSSTMYLNTLTNNN